MSVHTKSAAVGVFATPPDLSALPQTSLLDDKQTALALGVSPGTLSVWRSVGRYDLKYIKVGRKVRYRVSDVLAFLERRAKTHTGQEAA